MTIATASVPELKRAAEIVKTEWESLGVPTTVELYEQADLNQNVIRPREYQALLFGLSVGAEPDLFAFWHSSQRNDPGLNIAMYTNITADKLLAEERAESDATARAALAEEVAGEIRSDVPAAFLYSPEFIYILPRSILGTRFDTIDIPSDRFADVAEWYVYTEHVWKIFSR